METKLLLGDCLERIKELPDGSVHCCVTSPPYFGLRDYGVDGQIGLEQTPEAYVARLVEVFREVRRVLRDDGVLFLNLGDSYFSSSVRHEQSCGTSDTSEPGLQYRGLSSGSPRGERTDSWWRRISDTDCRLAHEQVVGLFPQILESMEGMLDHLPNADSVDRQRIQQFAIAMQHPVHVAIHVVGQLLAFPASMTAEYAPPPPGGLTPMGMLSACLSSLQTFDACAQQFVRKWADSEDFGGGNHGNALPSEELVNHIRCTCGYCLLVVSWLNQPNIKPYCASSQLLKPKNLIGIPWRVAFALQADGWYLRQDIIWSKPNPMPESVTDRCTKAHEYLFLLSKSARYYFDSEAIKEQSVTPPGLQIAKRNKAPHKGQRDSGMRETTGGFDKITKIYETRNRRSVWSVATKPYKGAHFATYPPELIRPCIKAGSPPQGTVLDPFGGSGTTAQVALEEGRNAIICELNSAYFALAEARINAAKAAIAAKPAPTPDLFSGIC